MIRRFTWLSALALSVIVAGCGGSDDGPSSPVAPVVPSAPAPPPPPSPSQKWTLSGVVSDDAATRAPLSGARVDVVEGTNQGRSATTNAEGRYRIDQLEAGDFSVRVAAEGMQTEVKRVTLSSDFVYDFVLRRVIQTRATAGHVVDGVSDSPLGLVMIHVDGMSDVTTSPDGSFRIESAGPDEVRGIRFSSSSVVERVTQLRIPGPDVTVPLIPASFDLRAFDEMFRGGGPLRRWTSAPGLVLQQRTLQYTNVTDLEYSAIDGAMSGADASGLINDLRWGLPLLSANQFTGFAAVQQETAAPGSRVRVSRPGEIVVARFEGLLAATGYGAYGRWATDGAGTVLGGIIMLDRGTDSTPNPLLRALRVHELGHAMGYDHVSAQPSVMNPSARLEPNEFDRSATRLAFQRPPGNRSPDTDPAPFTPNVRWFGDLIWSIGRP